MNEGHCNNARTVTLRPTFAVLAIIQDSISRKCITHLVINKNKANNISKVSVCISPGFL